MKPETPTCFLCDETKKGVKWDLVSLVWLRDNVTLCLEKHKTMVQSAVEKMQKDPRLPKEDESTPQRPAAEPKAMVGEHRSGINRSTNHPTPRGVVGPAFGASGECIKIEEYPSKRPAAICQLQALGADRQTFEVRSIRPG